MPTFATWEPLTNALIEHTAAQEHRVLSFFGVDARLVEMDGLQKRFVIDNPATGETYSTYIVLACTGIGSMSIFGGIIAAVNAPLKAKMKALAVTMPTIYVLNIARTAFITTAYGHQWFRIADDTISDFMNEPSGYASFFWADKVISQSLSVVVLVVLMLAVIRFMPGVMEMLEDLLELVGLGKETDDVSPEPDPDPETEAAT
ncbi:MAG: archaeosortase A [Halobacteria archaeon]|nr:archaeosortase A [Halobacteria archaeon]